MTRILMCALIAMSCHLSSMAAEPEKPSIEIAMVQMERLTNDVDYDRLRMLSLDKDTLEAIKKINAEHARLRKEIIDTNDEIKLMEIKKQIDFNNQKLSVLRDRNQSGREVNVRKIASDFIARRYGAKYALIVQDMSTFEGRVIYKNVKTVDITEDAAEAFKKELAERTGDGK